MREYEYEGAYALGAVGDYNGDHADDFVAFLAVGDTAFPLGIFAGSQNWRVDAPTEKVVPVRLELSLSASPNPFNESISVSYANTQTACLSLSLYDLQGRLHQTLVKGEQPAGVHNTSVRPASTGLYFLVLQSEEQRLVQKIVCVR